MESRFRGLVGPPQADDRRKDRKVKVCLFLVLTTVTSEMSGLFYFCFKKMSTLTA